MPEQQTSQTAWMSHVLWLAAAYNIIWGTFVVFFPNVAFKWADMAQPTYPQLWQCIGMVVGVYGIGYAIAATNPLRHWPIVLVGLLGKVFGPIGFFQAVLAGTLPWIAGWTILTNDLIWWIPFGLILHRVYATRTGETTTASILPVATAPLRTQTGETLEELSETAPLMVVFLRHFGCTFCRETLADLATKRADIESQGTRIVLVHMEVDDAEAAREVAKYSLEDLYRISDPDRTLYRKFGLKRGSLRQLFGLKVWWRGFRAGILDGHGVGLAKTDSFQMPGVFLLNQGKVVQSFRHNSAADRPDYEALAQCEAANTRMKKDLDMAAQVQQALLPESLPNIEDVSFSWILNPTDELAGDTLNVFQLDDDHVGLYVLDVSGHGVASALLSVTLHHWLSPRQGRAGVFKRSSGKGKYEIVSPSSVAEKLNQQFPQNLETGQYFTLVYGILNMRTRLFSYVTAGHPPPFHLPYGSKPVQLDGIGVPIGILPEPDYQDNVIQLRPGDRLYLYTDGLIETQNLDEEQFGPDRVIAQIEQDKTLTLNQSISNLENSVRKWSTGSTYADDIAVLALEISQAKKPEPIVNRNADKPLAIA